MVYDLGGDGKADSVYLLGSKGLLEAGLEPASPAINPARRRPPPLQRPAYYPANDTERKPGVSKNGPAASWNYRMGIERRLPDFSIWYMNGLGVLAAAFRILS